jgi:hypothetical protein
MKKTLFSAMAILAIGGVATAQYSSDFEAPVYTGTATGTDMTPLPSPQPGVDGWYQPVAANSLNYKCYTYAGNDLGFPQNPTGGCQFVAGRNTGGTFNTRTQRDFAWVAGTKYYVEWDIAFNYAGVLPATDNVGSFSLQNSATSKFWQTLYRFEAVATPTNVKAEYNVYNAAGVSTPNLDPANNPTGPWRNLKMNNWYRQRTVWDFTTNQVLEVGIQDVTGGGAMNVVAPVGWYLTGGAAPTLPMPTALRFFSGGTTAGNTVGWDNLAVDTAPITAPGPNTCAAACYPDCDGDGVLTIDDFICFQTFFALGDPYADCDGDGVLSIDDFICFQTFFAIGC